MKLKSLLLFPLMLVVLFLSSCLDTQTTEEQYATWKAANETFFESYKDSTGFEKLTIPTDRGGGYIYYKPIYSGSSTTATPLYNDSVFVHYKGWLMDGKVFDKTYAGTDPVWDNNEDSTSFRVNSLIKGWTEALMGMHVGDKWRIVIPWTKGYGESGTTGINPYSTLIFDIKLVRIVKSTDK
jgi:FKBP-type peptidyl-prolyl cis-trans isomerases 1